MVILIRDWNLGDFNAVLAKNPSYRPWIGTVLRGLTDPLSDEARYEAFVRTSVMTRLKRAVLSVQQATDLMAKAISISPRPTISGSLQSMASLAFSCLQAPE